MRRFFPLAAAALLAAASACTSSTTPPPRPAGGDTTPAPEKGKAVAKETDISAVVARATGTPRDDQDATSEPLTIVVDPATGKRLQRIPRSPQHFARRGRLYNVIVKDAEGFVIVKEDAEAWYIDAPRESSARPRPAGAVEEPVLEKIVDVPVEETEVAVPPTSQTRLRFEEISEGLPTFGMWRENFDLGDVDGDGRPEIVTPPARLSGKKIQIFKLEGKRWLAVDAVFEDPEDLGFEYGGIAVADMDGDGRPDIFFGKHGGGPAIATNKGSFQFRVASRGLPKLMTTRAMAIGDLDGDGKKDIVAISDEPEYMQTWIAEREQGARARLPRPDGYVPGIDTRAFFWRDGKFVEMSQGLEESCFGYTIGLFAPAPDGGEPFYASSCRYQGNAQVLYAFDKAGPRFHPVGLDVTERYSAHIGTAMGIYRGHPAAFMSYIKNGPQGASRNISGYGISVYFRDGNTWGRKRLLKLVQQPVSSQGLAVGDLNGDGLDDVVFADEAIHRIRVFFQTKEGGFQELAAENEPSFVNHSTAVRLADVDGDGRLDIVLMYQYLTGDETRSGGIRVFRSLR